MFVISRIRGGTDEIPEEIVEMAGSTGNIYSIKIGLEPSCTCPDNRKGNQCKHIIYVGLPLPLPPDPYVDSSTKVLHNVLKAPENLEYQLAFISSVSPNN